MIRILGTALLLASMTIQPVAAAESYVLDPTHTNIAWRVNHFGFSNPDGKFTKSSGHILLDEKNPAASSVEVTIGTASVMSGVLALDDHLKKKDFLDSEKYPTARFISTKIEMAGDRHAKVTGDFTLHGVTKPLTLDVTLNKIGEHPMHKRKTVGFSASATLKRSEYGINYGIPAVSDEVKLTIEAEASMEDTGANAAGQGKASANPSIH